MFLRLLLLFAILFSINANAESIVRVPKADGTVGVYKLLPVKYYDPTHADKVMKRPEPISRTDLPVEYNIPKELLPDVRDQGQRGTCAYFATVGLMETYLNVLAPENKTLKLSEQCLVALRNWMSDTDTYTVDDKPTDYRPDDDGDWPQLLTKSITYYGIPLEAKYPMAECRYHKGNRKGLPLETYQSIYTNGLSAAYGLAHPFDVDTKPTVTRLKELISKNIPVEVPVLVYIDLLYTSDWTWNSIRNRQLAGAHAVQLIGYKTKKNRTIFTFRNSWGGGWGARGNGRIDDKLITHTWGYDSWYDFIVSYHD